MLLAKQVKDEGHVFLRTKMTSTDLLAVIIDNHSGGETRDFLLTETGDTSVTYVTLPMYQESVLFSMAFQFIHGQWEELKNEEFESFFMDKETYKKIKVPKIKKIREEITELMKNIFSRKTLLSIMAQEVDKKVEILNTEKEKLEQRILDLHLLLAGS